MGTRSLTYVFDDNRDAIVCMYRQYDGYPSGHGSELAEFLNSGEVVNGLPMNPKNRLFNGMGCLAAQMVNEFKKESGGFYLHPPVLNRDDWQEYEYHVSDNRVIVYSGTFLDGKVIFDGCWSKFAEFCSAEELA
jgi:hypothetical protein